MRLRLEIAYHGADHEGWQSQPSGNTIQDHLEKAFAAITGIPARIHGAGRTDAGVHAEAQCAHIDLEDPRLPPGRLAAAVNAHLPPSIRILAAAAASPTFHARYSAVSKTYRYTIWNAPSPHPLLADRAWHVPKPLDPERLRQAASILTGHHDFSAFSLRNGSAGEQTVRTLASIDILDDTPRLDLVFRAPGFLHKMVRILTAAAVRHALGKVDAATLRALLRDGGPAFQHVAPAQGLTLLAVDYPAP
jgi:tRNA pseudouridine38-40 synthase